MQPLRVSCIQSDLHWESIDANLAMFEEKVWQIEDGMDLIILPEMFTTGFTMNADQLAEPVNGKTLRWMKQQAKQTGAMVMGSYVVKKDGYFFNRLYAVRPDGESQFYDKKHLFGLAGEDGPYKAGAEKVVMEWKGWRICPLICYDLRFPVWARSRSMSAEHLYEYDLIVFVASWPSPRIHAWDTLLQARAIENIAFCAGVNRMGTDPSAQYIGHSAIYDYTGKALALANESETIITSKLDPAMLQKFRDRFPFQADADVFDIHS